MTDLLIDAPERASDVSLADLAWLAPEDEAALAWQEEQGEAAITRIRQLGSRDEALEQFCAVIRQARAFPPRRAGPTWFRQEYRGRDGHAVLLAAPTAGGPGTVIASADAIDGNPRSLDYYFPSRDGRYVVVGWSERGTEQSKIEIVETATGLVLPFTAANARMGVVSWLGDSSGFYYDAVSESGARRLFLYRLGEPAAVEQVMGYRPGLVRARVSPDGSRVVVFCGYPNLVPVAWNDSGSAEPWQALVETSDGAFSGDLAGDTLVTLTTEGAPRGRVVSIPLGSANDRATWRELVSESELVLDTVSVVADRVVVGGLRNAAAEISTYALDGAPAGRIDLPSGAISIRPIVLSGVDPMFFATGEDLFFLHHRMTHSPAAYHYHVPTQSLREVAPSEVVHDKLRTRLASAISADGKTVYYEIIERADRAGPAPAMLHAYAGPYGLMPGYSWDLAAFAEAGGVVAIAHCRGGTELGPEWKDAARGPDGMRRKMDDLYAVAQALLDEKIAAAGHVGFTGSSAGGIVAGIAMTQRPDLFAVVCPQFALFDYAAIVPYLVAKATLSEGEYQREVEEIMALSPCHVVRPGKRYPATLIQMGADDAMTPPGSSRQVTALLRAADPAHDHLLLVYECVGHSTAPTVRHLAELSADWLTFCNATLSG